MRLLNSTSEPRTRTLIALEIGGLRLALTRTGSAARSAQTRRFGMGAFTGLAVTTLALAGASAAPQPQPQAVTRYTVTVDVPAPIARAVKATPRPASGRINKPRIAEGIAADAPFGLEDAPNVARAMTTGAFQEWEGADGQLRFLTAGPARAEGGRTCRDMALLIRLAEGGSRVRSVERCTTAPVSDAARPADPPEEQAVLQD